MSRFDRRLLAGRDARRGVAATALFGALQIVAVIAAAALLATIITDVFQRHATLASLRPQLVLFGVAVLGRALIILCSEGVGHRVAVRLISDLRSRSMRALMVAGPVSLARHRTGELVTLLGPGLDRLDAYFARFLPQTIVAVVLPVAAVVYVATVDWISALILVVSVPLIPLFMVLIGRMAERSTKQRWQAFQMLGGHFLDVLQGLPTLRLFNRGQAHVVRIRDMSHALRRTTMATLRVAFLSSFMLELLASLGTALVAVAITLRLVGGTLGLRNALVVLILTPEVCLPLRTFAGSFHASMEGVEAVRRLLDVVEPVAGDAPAGSVAVTQHAATPPPLSFEQVTFAYPGRQPLISGFDLQVVPGERVLLSGSSGSGKTTLLALILALVDPVNGRVRVGGAEPHTFSLRERGAACAWLPQRPHLFSGTVADNVRLGAPEKNDAEVEHGLRAVGADFMWALAGGIHAPVAEAGATFSGGQRQRIALARTLLRDSRLVLLDEPLAHLDPDARASVANAIERATRGRTVVIAAHGSGLFPWVDRIVTLDESERAPAPEAADRAEVTV
ncbi:MAG: thiol reductant ABC exporter subunit CydD [Candidatus Dormibacteraeota bacterium]|nr:thiol reductant ABC exporter subunit CydD [Candidatus Dormibacteraeota bacterium]